MAVRDGSATHAQQIQSGYRARQLSAYLPFDYDQADYDSCSENWSMSKMKGGNLSRAWLELGKLNIIKDLLWG